MDLDASDGYFVLNVVVEKGKPPIQATLDLFEAHNAAAAIADKHPGDTQPLEQAQAWKEYLSSCGVPPLSSAQACVVANEIRKAVEEFKKKHALDFRKPESCDFSGSPSGT